MFEGIMRTMQSLAGAGVVVVVGMLLVSVRGALRPVDLLQRIDGRTAQWLMPFLRSGGVVSQVQRQQIAALLPARVDKTSSGAAALVTLEPWLREPARTGAELIVRSRAHAVRRLDAHDRALQEARTLRAALWRVRVVVFADELRVLVDAAVWLIRAATDRQRLRLSARLAAWVGGGGALLSAVVVAGGTSASAADVAGEIGTFAAVFALLAALTGPARHRIRAAVVELHALPICFRVGAVLCMVVILVLAVLWQTGANRVIWTWSAQLADDLPTSISVGFGGAACGLMFLAVIVQGVRSALTRGIPLDDRLRTVGAVVLVGGAAVVGVVASVPARRRSSVSRLSHGSPRSRVSSRLLASSGSPPTGAWRDSSQLPGVLSLSGAGRTRSRRSWSHTSRPHS